MPCCNVSVQDPCHANSDECANFCELSSTPSTSKMLKVIRGRYRANMSHPSPFLLMHTSTNIPANFHECLHILKASDMLVKWKFMHGIQSGWLTVWQKNSNKNYFWDRMMREMIPLNFMKIKATLIQNGHWLPPINWWCYDCDSILTCRCGLDLYQA